MKFSGWEPCFCLDFDCDPGFEFHGKVVGKDVDIAIALVDKLMQIAPCYYVTGNHEAWIDSKFSELEEKLLNENVQILLD